MEIREFCRERDTAFFLRVYNRETKYAPYSVPLDEELLHDFVLKNADNKKEFIYICDGAEAEGIIHFGLNPDTEKEGHIYLLLAEKNSTAVKLLAHAENKLVQSGAGYIRCFPWWPNPYQFILYGVEPYGWAGLYTANNAFRQAAYCVNLDIVVMSLKLKERPENTIIQTGGILIEEMAERDDGLVTSGRFLAWDKGIQTGRSGYYRLNKISGYLGKGYGQIDIWINDEYQGKNLGKQLMLLAHQKLFDLGARNIILATNQNFFRAIKFYEGLGYMPESIRAWCYSKEIGID